VPYGGIKKGKDLGVAKEEKQMQKRLDKEDQIRERDLDKLLKKNIGVVGRKSQNSKKKNVGGGRKGFLSKKAKDKSRKLLLNVMETGGLQRPHRRATSK